jgi:uncharacterized protein (DUF488 family)
MNIYTIGYEGLDMDGFLTLLRNSGVETLVDVRELPLSRKAGFSKKGLGDTLNLNGFEYVHLPTLGCPKPIREQYRVDSDWSRYKVGFLKYLQQQQDMITEMAGMASVTTCALMCFEADYNYCHRSMVADAVKKVSGLDLVHLHASSLKKAKSETLSLEFA